MNKAANETYVVRIYRRDTVDPENVHGLIEVAGRRAARRFSSRRELVEILCEAPHSRSAGRVQGKIRRS